MKDLTYNYPVAFSRNLGWITDEEQLVIKSKRIAIAGLGGVGGIHLTTLLRMGFQKFHLADFDFFEMHNFNRQAGAFMSTLGRSKLDVMMAVAKDINPEVEIIPFPKGVCPENVDAFLKDCDIYLDGLDFFCFEIRRLVFATAYEKNIPAVTAGPLGMGSALVNFLPKGMTFDQYFGLSKAKDDEEKSVFFSLGLSPSRMNFSYLVDSKKIDFKNKKVPSTAMGCQMCSAVAGAEIIKIILKRGHVSQAPVSIQYDGYLNKINKTWIPFGYKNPLQRLRIYIALRNLKKSNGSSSQKEGF